MKRRAPTIPLRRRRAIGAMAFAVVVCAAACDEPGATAPSDPAARSAAPSDTTAATASSAAARPRPAPLPRELSVVVQAIVQGRCDEARRMASAYLAAHPEDGRAEFMIGYAYHRQGNHRPAIPHFERALELSPDYYVTHHFFGECLFLLGELDASRAQHEAHRAADPDDPDPLYGLGMIDQEHGDLVAAESDFRAAIALFDRMRTSEPRRFDQRKDLLARCHARLADILFARDDYEGARDELIAATTLSPGMVSALYTLSTVQRRLGDEAQAAAALARYEAAKAAILQRQGGGG